MVGAVLVAPFVWPYLQVQQREGFTRNLFEASRHAATPASYVSAPAVNLLYGVTGWLRTDRGAESELFPGLVVIVLAACRPHGGAATGKRGRSASRRPRSIVVGLVLSLGPDGVRALYAALHGWVFGFQAIRAPARFGVLVGFGLALLAALGMREIERWARARRSLEAARSPGRARPLLVLLAVEYAQRAAGMGRRRRDRRTPVGGVAARRARTRRRLYLPMACDIDNTPVMVEALGHRRPIVNGYSGQRPAFFGGVVDALHTFPSAEAMWMLHDLDVRFVVTPRRSTPAAWPLVERARFARRDGGRRARVIYELAWSEEVEARLGEPATPVPPPPGAVPFAPGERLVYRVTWDAPTGAVEAGDGDLRGRAPPPRRGGGHRYLRRRRADGAVDRALLRGRRSLHDHDRRGAAAARARAADPRRADARSISASSSIRGAHRAAADRRRPASRAAAAPLARGARRGRPRSTSCAR